MPRLPTAGSQLLPHSCFEYVTNGLFSVQPVTMVVASRPVENPEIQGLLAAMAAEPDCEVLAPATLSRDAVEEIPLA